MSSGPESVSKSRFSISSSAQMLWALVFGVMVGLFFGEAVAWMSVIGNSVILLMQMTVFPYIVVSLVGGIGKLTKDSASMLFSRSGIVMLSLWVLGLVVIFLMPFAFPEIESASFFSTSSIEEPTSVDYFKLYIPSNPFESMAQGYVPAMVLFSIAMGLALIGMKGESKLQILSFMSTCTDIFSRITQGLIKVLPIGIFAMSASAAGTMGIDEFASMQVYLLSMLVMSGLLAFGVLPWVISSLTPLSFSDSIRISKSGVVTAFATGNVFIVVPVIIEECKQIMREYDALDDEGATMIDILVPIAFSFPNIGKLTVILFVFFAGWFTGKPVDLAGAGSLAVSGLLSLFGSVYVAIPFMLELVQLPADLFQLFVMSGFITGKFGSVVAVMNLFALTLISIAIFQKVARFGLISWLRLGIGLIVGCSLVIISSRLLMETFIDKDVNTSEVIANMRIADDVLINVSRDYPVLGETLIQPIANIAAIKNRGVLKVGYRPSNVPFSYYNNRAELVGFDVEMASMLAKDLGVEVEFIPFRKTKMAEALDNGFFDIAMSGLAMSIKQMQTVNYTAPVVELNRALVMPDHKLKQFKDLENIKTMKGVTVAYAEHDEKINAVKHSLSNIKFEEISGYKRFFQQKNRQYDALIISAQAGSAWTLFYPEYGVLLLDKNARYPVAYAVAWENTELLRFVDNWLKLRKVDGSQDRAYDYWVLGKNIQVASKRWSVIKDVLHWQEG
ncbi:MAG: cation:dicarboxylase symporter family transporter [Oleispira sp.]|nr:cation:dicarboxylase symporter family transporter [Oleispira sp.]MBL4882490.1 cation:dicarboxylase symporter family transporter [Oleispira sp.]